MAILGCNFDINFGETLAPGSSLSNILRTCINGKFYSIMVESNVKSIWQHNLPMDFYGAFKIWCLKGKKWGPPSWNSKTKSQRSEPKWLFEVPHHTQLLCQVSAKSVDHNFWPLEHSLRQWHLEVEHVYETWNQCQWIIGTLTCKHKISGENLWHLKPHLITFLVSNFLEGWRRYKLMSNLGIVKFFERIMKRFLH